MDAPAWSAQLLAEFVAVVSTAETGTAAAHAAVERAAEALDADVAAIVCGGELVAAVGYPQVSALVAELAEVRPGGADAWLQVPGVGSCPAAAAMLEYPPGARLVLARSGSHGLSPEETGLLRGMARVAAMTMRMLDILDQERSARDEAGGLTREQAALRRVATLVARGASAEEMFSAVAGEVARLSEADATMVLRYETDGSATVMGGWGDHGGHLAVGVRMTVEGQGVAVSVLRTGRSARAVPFAGPPGSVADAFRRAGVRAGSGSPILVEGRLWGVMIAARAGPEPLPRVAEDRIPAFTELVAAAMANAESRGELRRVADEQVALRRVATLVAHGAPPTAVFATVAEEVGRLFAAESTIVARYDPDGTVVVGSWSRTGEPYALGSRMPRGGQNVTTLVFQTGRPARIDRYAADDSSVVTAIARRGGMRSAIGAPIIVEGRLWGAMALGSPREAGLAPGLEERLAAFAELAATAIANAEAREELRRVADEQAALRRVAILIAQAAPPEELFSTVIEEVGRLLSVDIAALGRYGTATETLVAAWRKSGTFGDLGNTSRLGGNNVATLVFETGRPARIDHYLDATGEPAAAARQWDLRASVGAPVTVQGRLWGVIHAASISDEPLPADTEARLVNFTELLATAIANAQARGELHAIADEQAALGRVATLVARAAPPGEVFTAVAGEVHGLLDTDLTAVSRYDPDDMATVVGAWAAIAGPPLDVGYQRRLGERTVRTLVFRTGRPARIDDLGEEAGPWVTAADVRSAVGVPISVEGRLWGVISVASGRGRPLPADTEERLAGFTELVATAIANAQAQAQLTASRARLVATADQTRLRIERDLHDGAQQRLVSLALQLRAAQAAVPPQLSELSAELGRVAVGLGGALDELREYARGIHPAILAERGLGPALKTLARRFPVPVDLQMQVEGRLPERVEVSAYHVVSEALANAAKHAHASAVTVIAEVINEVLRVVVRDDGVGGAGFTRGTGLVGLKDRVEALDGRIFLDSPRTAGTTLRVELPLTDAGQPRLTQRRDYGSD